jgi:hypothetical protein
MMSVTNSGQKVTKALLTLHYDNGQKKYEMQQTIQPGGQMWVNVASLIRNRVPDRKGNVLPADAAFGTYDLRDLSPGLGSLSQGTLTLESTFGFSAKPVYANCCGTYGAEFGVAVFDLGVDDESLAPVNGTDECNGDIENISADFDGWWSANSAIATVAPEQVTGVSAGTTTAWASGDVLEGDGGYCALEPVQVNAPVTVQGTPDSETTTYYGTYQITEGSFQMTLNPATYSYDGHYVTESDYATGTDTCYWPGANLTNPPAVAGSTWTVGQNGAGHNQYGLDSIGFNSVGVSYIQQNAAEHDVDFPCVVTFYQEMEYEIDANTFIEYAENVDTQTIGSSTVNVCRAGVCTGSIPW